MQPLIYQIYPRSFKDSNGDGIGDLKGILEKVDHIASLGCDFVWISPFFKSPMKDYGYDVSDYRTVDPVFGTNKDFETLIKALKKRGVKVMVDFVAAHTSNEHPWFEQSRQSRNNPYADWYVWVDPKPDGSPPNNWMSCFGGSAWQWEPRRQQYYLRKFLREQPCLNHYCPAVRRELLDTMDFWLKKGVRGFRLDAIQHAHYDPKLRNNPAKPGALEQRVSDPYGYQTYLYSTGRDEGLQIIRDMRHLANKYPGTFLLGEISQREIARRYTGPDLLNCCYFSDLTYLDTLATPALRIMLSRIFNDYPKNDFCWAMNCHDGFRHMTRFAHAPEHAAAVAVLTSALFLLMPGTYSMYQGEELGLPSAELTFDQLVDPFDRSLYPHHLGRDSARTPMPWTKKGKHAGFSTAKTTWLPLDPRHAALAAEGQEKAPVSTLNKIRAIIAWRKKNLTPDATYTPLHTPNGILMHRIEMKKKAYTFAFNMTDKEREVTLRDEPALEKISVYAQRRNKRIILPPYGFIVAS
jgi:alpha-glucosidase